MTRAGTVSFTSSFIFVKNDGSYSSNHLHVRFYTLAIHDIHTYEFTHL